MTRARLALALAVPLSSLSFGCGKSGAAPDAKTTPVVMDASRAYDAGVTAEAGPREDPRTADLWTRAIAGDEDELARLARFVGSEGLVANATVPARRATALRALALVDDFVELPFLASVAGGVSDEDAAMALDSIQALASQPRRATDPDDALEVHDGTVALLALAKDPMRPPPRRARVVSVLRLLAARGWVQVSDVPADLDAR